VQHPEATETRQEVEHLFPESCSDENAYHGIKVTGHCASTLNNAFQVFASRLIRGPPPNVGPPRRNGKYGEHSNEDSPADSRPLACTALLVPGLGFAADHPVLENRAVLTSLPASSAGQDIPRRSPDLAPAALLQANGRESAENPHCYVSPYLPFRLGGPTFWGGPRISRPRENLEAFV